GLPPGSRRLLHVPRGNGGRLRGPPRPDRLQAGRARGNRGLGGYGLRMACDRRPPRCRRGASLGTGPGRRLRLATPEGMSLAEPVTEPAVEVVDLAVTPLRELNARLHSLDDGAAPRRWRVLHPNGAH